LDFVTGVSLILPEFSPDYSKQKQEDKTANQDLRAPPGVEDPTAPLQELQITDARILLESHGSSSSSSLETPRPTWHTPPKTSKCIEADVVMEEENQLDENGDESDSSLSSPTLSGSPLRRYTLECTDRMKQKNRTEEGARQNEDYLQIKHAMGRSPPKTPMIKCGELQISTEMSSNEVTPSMDISPPKTQTLLGSLSNNDSPDDSSDNMRTEIRFVTEEEYSAAPKFLKIQVSLDQLNASIQPLNELLRDGNSEIAEQAIEDALGSGSKTKTIILSLVHLQRLTMNTIAGRKVYRLMSIH